ncbi:MAG: serine/threonine protein kinase [Sulfuricellaceae bacterium]|jgi:serine/threonine protein kinase
MEQPTMLGKYAVEGELGRGAMGIVYRGHDPDLDREVAIKTFRKDALDKSESAELLERFKREAQAGGRLQHPNIVSIYDYGESDDVAYIAMEIIQGQELKELFDQNRRFAPKDAVRLMSQLLDALEYAHRHGVVHRDIKPANLILMPDGTLKITDFGIARLESSTLTQAGTVLGTPTYMSPEQFMGQTVDGRSDLFSAGVILYQFLTGEKPFAGSSITTIMHKVLKEEPLKPSELNVQVPPAFDGVVKKALAKRPDDRFQSAAEFRAALMAAVEAPAVSPDAEITSVNLAIPPVAAAAKPPAKPWLWLGVGGASVAALLAFILLRPAAEPETPPAPEAGAAASLAPAANTTTAAAETKPQPAPPTKAHTPEKTAEKPKTTKTAQASKKDKEKSATKKGVFGEDLKPSPWRKEGDLF